MFKILVVWGSKDQKKESNLGTAFIGKFLCPEFNQIHGKGQVTNKDLKTNFDVENVDGFGVKNNKERGQPGVRFYMKINVSRILLNHWNITIRNERSWNLIWMIILVGVGVKGTKKEGKQGAKIT